MSVRSDEAAASPLPRITGRSSSHYTRLARMFALELDVACEFAPVYDLASLDERSYTGNPALKLPVLSHGGTVVFGTENICRTLAELAPRSAVILWPENLRDAPARNAQELVWHAMQAQVQLGFGTQIAGLSPDSIYFVKAATGLRNALAWLDERAPSIIATLPPHDLGMLEVSLFCLLEHLAFRTTVPLAPYVRLGDFARVFGQRASARSTTYRFDTPARD